MPATHVLVTGGTGFLGSALVAALLRHACTVTVLSRDATRARARLGAGVGVVDRLTALPTSGPPVDAVVHLAGARVIGPPWTPARRRVLLDSRVGGTRDLLAWMERLERRPQVLVAASAIGYYGVPADPAAAAVAVDESAPPRPTQFASQLCIAVEEAACRAEALGLRVVRPRFGVLLGRGDGAWPMQALAARLGLGSVIGSGRQPAPWLHLADAVGIVRFALDTPAVAGALNAVAPQACTQAEFVRALAATYGRAVHLRVPGGLLRGVGGEMMSLLLDGQAVAPHALQQAGYRFQFPTLGPALADLAGVAGQPGTATS